jgi:hypothetical protein
MGAPHRDIVAPSSQSLGTFLWSMILSQPIGSLCSAVTLSKPIGGQCYHIIYVYISQCEVDQGSFCGQITRPFQEVTLLRNPFVDKRTLNLDPKPVKVLYACKETTSSKLSRMAGWCRCQHWYSSRLNSRIQCNCTTLSRIYTIQIAVSSIRSFLK